MEFLKAMNIKHYGENYRPFLHQNTGTADNFGEQKWSHIFLKNFLHRRGQINLLSWRLLWLHKS